jgi:hypothetical protein
VLPVVGAASAPGDAVEPGAPAGGDGADIGRTAPDRLPATGGGPAAPLVAVVLVLALAVVSVRATTR